jgi:hypothetical protein
MTGIPIRRLSIIAYSELYTLMRSVDTARTDRLKPGNADNTYSTPSRTASFIPVVVFVPKIRCTHLCTNPVIVRKIPMTAINTQVRPLSRLSPVIITGFLQHHSEMLRSLRG